MGPVSYDECRTAGCKNKRYEGSAGKLAYCKDCLKKKGVVLDGNPKKDPEQDEIWPLSYRNSVFAPSKKKP